MDERQVRVQHVPLFGLGTNLMPGCDLGLHVFEPRYKALVEFCLETGTPFGVVQIAQEPDADGTFISSDVGTLAEFSAHARLRDGRFLLEVVGTQRFRVLEQEWTAPYPAAHIEVLMDSIGDFGVARKCGDGVERLCQSFRAMRGEYEALNFPADPMAKSWMVASLLPLEPCVRQEILEMSSAAERLERLVSVLRIEIAVLDQIAANRGSTQ